MKKVAGDVWNWLNTTVFIPLGQAIQHIIDLWNSSPLGKAGNAVGGMIGGAINAAGGALKAIGLAEGGIVTQPTFALIGEAGPEAVVPLSGMTGGGSFGGSGSININIGSLQGTDQQAAIKFANQIARILNQQLKLKNY